MKRVPIGPSFLVFACRCATVAALVGACSLVPALAGRIFPAGSMQGNAVFGAFPSLSVNCTSYALGPGVRVYDPAGHLLLTDQLPGLTGRLVFQRDSYGNVFKAWFMAPDDPALAPVPVAPGTCFSLHLMRTQPLFQVQ